MRRILLLLLTLLLTSAASPAALEARSLTIRSFDVEMVVRPDGTLLVTEQIQMHFSGSWNGFVRSLPVRYRTDQGLGYALRVELESITDQAGNPLRYESSRASGNREWKIWVPGAQDATRMVVIRYRVLGGLRFFDEQHPTGAHDELYWNVTGTEWEMPIQKASARIYLPEGAAGMRAEAFTGRAGASEQAARVEMFDNLVTVRATRPFAAFEGMTVVVGWEPGLVERPGAAEKAGGLLRSNWLLFLPFFAFLGMFRHWYRNGRDPKPGPLMVHYEPPQGLTPAEVGTLVDHSADLRDITSTLVDLAVRGYIVIEELTQKKLLGLVSESDYLFHLVKPSSEWKGLRAHERRLLQAIFGSHSPATEISPRGAARRVEHAFPMAGAFGRALYRTLDGDPSIPGMPIGDISPISVRLSSLDTRFYTHLGGIRSAIYDRLVAGGFYQRRPDQVKTMYMGAAVVVGAGLAFLGFAAGTRLDIEPMTGIVAGVLTGLIVMGFGYFMPARTSAGTRALGGALGFREFLSRVESDRFKRMITSPQQFEQYLPYALALQVEDRWAAAFEGMYREPPEWYRGTNRAGFRPALFVRDLGRMTGRASSAMTSQPKASSSGSSGFGGGGRSGGGFGGGGGRGF